MIKFEIGNKKHSCSKSFVLGFKTKQSFVNNRLKVWPNPGVEDERLKEIYSEVYDQAKGK